MKVYRSFITSSARMSGVFAFVCFIILLISGLASAASSGISTGPVAVISPAAGSYPYTSAPTFNIETGSNRYYMVEFALGDGVFAMADGSRYKIQSGVDQNFYRSAWWECLPTISIESFGAVGNGDESSCSGGLGSFTLDSTVWMNMRASVVFFRLLSNSSESVNGATVSQIGSVRRTGESWYGLPLNNRAMIGSLAVIDSNGLLNGRAISSDYGPRYVAGGTRFHPGIDIPVSVGTPVYAIAQGSVQSIPGSNSSDHVVDIRHDGEFNGLRTGYVHLDHWVVNSGDDVQAGQLIGYSGDWVNSAHGAAHLHLDSGRDSGGQIYYNPLHLMIQNRVKRYLDNHTLSAGSGTFLVHDNYTNGNEIDVRPDDQAPSKVIIGFGVTTDYDKDLNYVEVQVDDRTEAGQYFELDYDEVEGHERSGGSYTGVILLENGKKFYIFRNGESIETPSSLSYPFYVLPMSTNINAPAKDYFYMIWDVAPYGEVEDGGPHRIKIALGEVDGHRITREVVIGPEISVGSSTGSGHQLTYPLKVTNHDIERGAIKLEVKNLPANWTSSFSNDNPMITANGEANVTLTLTTDQPASETLLCGSSSPYVVSSLGRIPSLKDKIELCPKVWITNPKNDEEVTVGNQVSVEVKTKNGGQALDVRLYVDDALQQISPTFNGTKQAWVFPWTPSVANHLYELKATAVIDGGDETSGAIKVFSVNPGNPGFVWINKPVEGEDIPPGFVDYPVEVQTSPSGSGTTNAVTLKVYDGDPQNTIPMETITLSAKNSDGTLWGAEWDVPPDEGEYILIATADFSNGSVHSAQRRVDVVVQPSLWIEVTFKAPTDGQNDLVIGSSYTVTVEAKDTSDVDVQYVLLDVTPGDGDPGGYMIERQTEPGVWDRQWKPQPLAGVEEQHYTLYASARDADGFEVGHAQIQVTATGSNPVDPTIIVPSVAYVSVQMEVIVRAYGADNVQLTLDGMNITLQRSGSNWLFYWTPGSSAKGSHSLVASVHYPSGETKTVGETFSVVDAPPFRKTPINEYAFLGTVENIKQEFPLDFSQYIPLDVSSDDYVCGVVGYEARGGDIGENYYEYDPGDIIGVFLRTTGGHYELMADFDTLNRYLDGFFYSWEDRPETWDVHILCVKKTVAADRSFNNRGDNIRYNTGISIDEKACGIAGFHAQGGDIDEGGGDIIQMYLYRNSGRWNIRADFDTHNGRNENWSVNLLCLDDGVASFDGPVPDKPFFLQEFLDLGDNVGPRSSVNTGYSTDDYVCGVSGFAANGGNIDEGNYENEDHPLFLAYMYPSNGTWHIRADFRTDSPHENWNVNVVCARKDGAEPAQWNVSHQVTKSKHCMSTDMACQILRSEAMQFREDRPIPVTVVGGGYSSAPSMFGSACGHDAAYVEVYMDDRDPSTGDPRWENLVACLRDGESYTFDFGNHRYDLRGASMRGGRTKPFELYSTYGAPLITSVVANRIPAPYGPGMIITWTPTTVQGAAFYEVQFSDDNGGSWHPVTPSSTVSVTGGGADPVTIKHQGDLACGFGYMHCLLRKHEYYYRVRVLEGTEIPITDWSIARSAISGEWPAHVALDEPWDPYKYREVRVVELKVKEAYGEGLSLHWEIEENGGATYVIQGGCGDNVTSCKITIYAEWPTDEGVSASNAVGLLADPPSIDVILSGTDVDGHTDYDSETFVFEAPTSGGESLFSDVLESHWAYEPIQYLGEMGYVSGRSTSGDALYYPEDFLTRAEVAVVLVRSDHPEEMGYVPPTPVLEDVVFLDLEPGMSVASVDTFSEGTVINWWTKYVEELRASGRTAGCSSDPPLYCPNDFVSRAEMATFVVKIRHAEGFTPVQPANSSFSDVPYRDMNGNLDWRVKWIEQAFQDGLIQDCGTDMGAMHFRPAEAATRAEMACMVYNALMGRDGP